MIYGSDNNPMLGDQLNYGHWSVDGLRFYWRGIEAGNAVDESPCGNHGTITGATWVGGALDFSKDDVNIGATVYDSVTTEMTIICCFMHQGEGSSYGRIIDKYPGPTLLVTTSNTALRFYGTIGGTNRDKEWTTAIYAENEWTTAAAVFGPSLQACYINGVLADGSLDGGPYAGAYSTGPGIDAVLGNRASDGRRDWDGLISYMIIYDRALLAWQVEKLHRNPNLPIWQEPMWEPVTLPSGIVVLRRRRECA